MSSKKKTNIGRPKLYRTDKQRLEAKKKQDRECQERVKLRRYERYHNDPEYRAKMIERSRKYYEQKGCSTTKDFTKNIKSIDSFSTKREVSVGKKTNMVKTLSVGEVASFFELSTKSFIGWLRSGKFPWAKQKTTEGGAVYTQPQVIAMAKALNKNLSGRAKFRSSDSVAISEVHSAFLKNQ